jgi:hypothetical protein
MTVLQYAEMMKKIIDVATNSEQTHTSCELLHDMAHQKLKNYFRFNPPLAPINLDESDMNKLQGMINETVQYINKQLQTLEVCAKYLN